jgi:hypothetical protein
MFIVLLPVVRTLLSQYGYRPTQLLLHHDLVVDFVVWYAATGLFLSPIRLTML